MLLVRDGFVVIDRTLTIQNETSGNFWKKLLWYEDFEMWTKKKKAETPAP